MESAGNVRKKLKHRLAAFLAALSRRAAAAGRRRKDAAAAAAAAAPPLAYTLLGGKARPKELERHLSLPAFTPRAAPLVHITIDCAGRRSVDAAAPSLLAPAPLKKERRLTETGLFYETGGKWDGRMCPPSSPFLAPPDKLSCSARRKLVTTSSSDDDVDDDDDDPRHLFSSRSFSSDSSDFYNCPRKARARPSAACRPPAARKGASQSCRYSFELPRRSAAAADAGFAVVKRSADPYEDFRKSMEEMVAEWPARGNGAGDAERLLETYLVLNSPRHYPAILTAFADVRDGLVVDRINLLS